MNLPEIADINIPLFQGSSRGGYVYVIRRTDTCHKIGRSRQPRHRCKALQAITKDTNLRVVAQAHRPNGDDRVIERVTHTLLERWGLGDEWYEVTEEQAIRAIARAIAAVERDRNGITTIKNISAEQ